MGYYVEGHGCITFASKLTNEQIEKIDNVLSEVFETDFDKYKEEDYCCVDLYGKYDWDEISDAMYKVSEITEIKEGEIEFHGDSFEDFIWRLLWENGEWIEQQGRIVYE